MPAAVSDEERRKKSVYYDACTSPFKDDFPTLVKCLKTPEPGNPHTRQEAGFLLWHHALEGDEVAGLLAAGLLTACVANLDSAELLPADKACSAGILLALAGDDEDVAEQLVRTRGPTGRSALEVLHAVLAEDEALARHHCGRLLQALAQLVGPAMLRAMDQQLPYMGSYLAVWGLKQHGDAPAVAAVGELVSLLLVQRPELGPELVAAGAVWALLDVVRHHKSEAAVGAAAQCLWRLLPLEGAVEQLAASGGVPLLVDVLGPPPRGPLENRPEVVQEDEPGSPASEPPSPSPLPSPLAAAVATAALAAVEVPATESPRSSRGGDDDAAADRASGGGDAAGGESADSPVAVSPASAAESPPAAESSGNRVSFVQHEPATPTSPSKAPAGAAAACSGGSPSGGGSPLGSRFRLSTGAAASGGEAGGSGWASARSSSRSLGSHPSVNLRAVQLPLVIPGINSPSAAAVAAAAEAGAPSPYPPTALLHSTLRAGMAAAAASAAGSEAVASLTAAADGGGDAAAAAAAASPAAPPPLPTADDLVANRSGLRWFMLPGLEVASRAAACLTQVVMQRPSCQVEAELRLTTHRLMAQVKTVMGPKAAGGAEGPAQVPLVAQHHQVPHRQTGRRTDSCTAVRRGWRLPAPEPLPGDPGQRGAVGGERGGAQGGGHAGGVPGGQPHAADGVRTCRTSDRVPGRAGAYATTLAGRRH